MSPRLDPAELCLAAAGPPTPSAMVRPSSHVCTRKAGAAIVKDTIRSLLANLGYRIEGIRYTPRQLLESGKLRKLEFDDVICRLIFEKSPEVSFIQIGAFDLSWLHPLRSWSLRQT